MQAPVLKLGQFIQGARTTSHCCHKPSFLAEARAVSSRTGVDCNNLGNPPLKDHTNLVMKTRSFTNIRQEGNTVEGGGGEAEEAAAQSMSVAAMDVAEQLCDSTEHNYKGCRACLPVNGISPKTMGYTVESLALSEPEFRPTWQFLLQLPHKLIRDIGFVVACPSLLLDSHELPMVSSDFLGGSNKYWQESAKWLLSLEIDQVVSWFQGKRNNGRLGQHFAFCVEYILQFSPVFRVKCLLVSQQVLHQVVHESLSELPELADRGVMDDVKALFPSAVGFAEAPKVTVDVLPGEVIIKVFLGVHQNIPSKDIVTSVNSLTANDIVDSSGEVSDNFQDFGQLQLHDKEQSGKGMHDADANTNVTHDRGLPETHGKLGKRKKRQLRKLHRLREGKGPTVTVGEFDFLFEPVVGNLSREMYGLASKNMDISLSSSEQNGEASIHHWEVSVKFLLYAGPWEMFGFETPLTAAWRTSSESSEEFTGIYTGCPGCKTLSTSASQAGSGCACNDMLFGCYLGPHIGETLYNRKMRLINQIALSEKPHSALLLCRLFHMRYSPHCDIFVEPILSEKLESGNKNSFRKPAQSSCSTQGLQSKSCGDLKILRVFPKAVLKGYLFYEYHLWFQLISNKCHLRPCKDKTLCSKSNINPGHWLGWWTRVGDFLKFAGLPIHYYSKWYIVPKLEWLSPVIIEVDDMRQKQLLDMNEFLIMAGKVQDEAERTKIPRKRRFMVAEMSRDPDLIMQSMKSQFEKGEQNPNTNLCKWVEVSRGFVVEDTWPDSKMYRPHGYRLVNL